MINFKKKEKEVIEPTPEMLAAEKLKRRKKARRRKTMRIIDRIFGFFLATGIVIGCACLALEYIIVKGPSPSLSDAFVMTMLETRRFKWIPRIYLSGDEINEIKGTVDESANDEMDTSLINVAVNDTDPDNQTDDYPYDTYDEDGDGLIMEVIKGTGYQGYLLTVLDPSRVFVGMPDSYGGNGMTLPNLVEKYGAIGGINAGGFVDDKGAGMGGLPDGLTIIDGVCYNEGYGGDSFAGFDENGILHVGYYSLPDVQHTKIRDGVSFGPILIRNGEQSKAKNLVSGVNPRTAIGQRADGAVLMLVIDGRQAHSIGATYQDVIDVMLDHGAVNACNMDGGSSTSMYLNGEYVNSCASASGESRYLPNAFLIKPLE